MRFLLVSSFILLFTCGLYFSIKLSFPQIKLITLFRGLKNSNGNGISPIKALMLSLGARIGVGSLAGIALSIYIGGIGTIFWIIIGSIITSILTFCESYLGQKYQVKKDDNYIGGPMYYITNKKMAKYYAIILILTYIIGFIPIQANTIVTSISNYFDINKIIIILLLLLITVIPILKGLNRIIDITGKIVPIIGIIYILLTIYIIIKNINIIPRLLINIVKSSFNLKSFIIGIQRGIFITESGLGTSSISSSCTYTNNKIDLSLSQIIGIYFTIFIVCISTALIVLTSNYNSIIMEINNGIELTQYSYTYHLGNMGSIILLLSIFFLAYSTILAGYFYSERAFEYIKDRNKILKTLTILFIIIGCLVKGTKIWYLTDTLIEILILINIYYLFKYRKEIIIDYKNKT